MRNKINTIWILGLVVLIFGLAPLEAGSRHYRGHRRSHVSFHVYPFSWGYWGPWAYGGYYGGQAYPRPALSIRDVGAINLKVRPKKAAVYVDGELAGNAGRFDGFPGYLWLDQGQHQIVLEYEGYLTIAKIVEVREGTLTDIRLEMQSGDSQPAAELFQAVEPKPTRPAHRVADRDERPRDIPRVREEARPSRNTAQVEDALDARDESARLSVEVTPEDASVYLDGRFLGTVADLTRLHAGILVSPGAHTLSAVRPGYLEAEIDFEAESAEELVLKIDLRSE